MYPTKTPGILEMLVNALSFPTARRTSAAARTRRAPRRHRLAVESAVRHTLPATETFFDAARLSRWNR